MNSISGNNNQQIKFLFARLREHLEHQRQQHENSSMVYESGTESSDDDSEDSSHCGPIKNTINRRCAQTSCTDEKKPSSTPQGVNSEVRSPPPYTLPYVTFKEDDCDEAEKLARAKRIEVIMRLSAEAKAKEAERKRVANIRPLSWDKPTFDYPSNSSTSNSSTTTTAAAPDVPPKAPSPTLGKRKSRQEGLSRSSHSRYFASSRIATEDEIQSLVDFANEYFPSGKRRRSTDKGGDDQKS